MQKNIEINLEIRGREMRHKENSDAYKTAENMLMNFTSYMKEEDKLNWFKILNSKALLMTGQNDESNSTYFTPASNIRGDNSRSSSRNSSITSTSSTSYTNAFF